MVNNKKEQIVFENNSAGKEIKIDPEPINNPKPEKQITNEENKTKNQKQITNEENKTKNQKPLLYGKLLKINKRK